MDDSVEDVTLLTGFVFDVLKEYENVRRLCAPAFELARNLDPHQPRARCPITVYNNVCDWIETNVGTASIRNAGRAIGKRAYSSMVDAGKLFDPKPQEVMEALVWAADTMIHDPKRRGWLILECTERKIIMRRTQTFNCILQEGLLLSLVERTGVLMPSVKHVRCTRIGDPYCEYVVSWLSGTTAGIGAPTKHPTL